MVFVQTAMVAFNTLRRIGQEILTLVKETSVVVKAQRWRLRTVLQNIMFIRKKQCDDKTRHGIRCLPNGMMFKVR